MEKIEKNIPADLDGFEDICNETELLNVNAGCADKGIVIGSIGPTSPIK